MKKIVVLGITLVLLLGILTSCPNGNENQPQPERMVFVDDVDSPNVKFIIDENLRFRVMFITLDTVEHLGLPGMVLGVEVLGRVRDTQDTWTDNTITGSAQEMSARGSDELDETLAGINLAGGVGIVLTYSPADGEIESISVEFTGHCGFDPAYIEDCVDPVNCVDQTACFFARASQAMMGGTYIRIE